MVPDICKTAGNIVTPAPKEEQGLFFKVYSISVLIRTEHPDCTMAWSRVMFRNMYGGINNWQDRIPDILTKLGLDANAVIKKAADNEEHYFKIIEQNEADNHTSGHGGVPNAVHRGKPERSLPIPLMPNLAYAHLAYLLLSSLFSFLDEPFWGHDCFDTLVWRLKQNGMTKRYPKMIEDWTL